MSAADAESTAIAFDVVCRTLARAWFEEHVRVVTVQQQALLEREAALLALVEDLRAEVAALRAVVLQEAA